MLVPVVQYFLVGQNSDLLPSTAAGDLLGQRVPEQSFTIDTSYILPHPDTMDNMNRTEKSITSAATASGTSTMTTACQSTSRWIPSKPQSKSPLSIRGQRLRNTRGSMYARTLVSCGMPISRSDRRSWSSVPKVTSRIPASSRPSSLPFQQPSQQQQGLSSTERQSTKRPQQHWRIAVPPEVKGKS